MEFGLTWSKILPHLLEFGITPSKLQLLLLEFGLPLIRYGVKRHMEQTPAPPLGFSYNAKLTPEFGYAFDME